jgi:formate/nitrite transporter FocA (FNT family)
MVMLQFAFIIGYNHIIAPMFSAPSLPIVPDMWELLKLGLGGYVIGRSAEKIAQEVLPAIIANKKQ